MNNKEKKNNESADPELAQTLEPENKDSQTTIAGAFSVPEARGSI